MSAVKVESQVDLVVHLERWREDKFYDRFGLDEETVNILGIDIPIITIPVQPGPSSPPWRVMVGARAWERYSSTLVVKATVVSWSTRAPTLRRPWWASGT